MSRLNNVLTTFAAYSKDVDCRMLSSSGAIFSLLADAVLGESGIVYGVAMSEDCKNAVFKRATNMEELEPLRSSKYIQARVENTYKSVREDLASGKTVLFTGTGCQVNGLKLFLGKDYDSLFCVDVICHGVPSPGLWRKYVAYMEAQNGVELRKVNFRCKDDSWTNYGIKEIDEQYSELYIPKNSHAYFQMFLRNYSLRPSCYECVAKDVKSGDITIGDFWGIQNVAPELNDNKGVSLVLVRSRRGKDLFEKISEDLIYKEVSYNDGVKENSPEYMPVERPKLRNSFYIDAANMSFDNLMGKYADPLSIPLKRRVKDTIKKILRRKHTGGA